MASERPIPQELRAGLLNALRNRLSLLEKKKALLLELISRLEEDDPAAATAAREVLEGGFKKDDVHP